MEGMSEQDNVKTALKFFDGLNSHAPGANRELQTSDFKQESPGAMGQLNTEQAEAYINSFFEAFPDLHFDIRHTIAQGDYVVVNWMSSGTHTGGLRTPTGAVLPPTGKKAMVPGSSTYLFKGGKAAMVWVHWDMVTLLAQLGLMPGM
jgi:predicted ester cyclase